MRGIGWEHGRGEAFPLYPYELARLLSRLSNSGTAGKNSDSVPRLSVLWDVPWAAGALHWQFEHSLEPIPVDVFAKAAEQGQAGIVAHLQKRSFRPAVP